MIHAKGLGGLKAIGGLESTVSFLVASSDGEGRKIIDQVDVVASVAPGLPPLFRPNDDVVDFANAINGAYVEGTQDEALSGNDNVILPSTAAIAGQADYDPWQEFYGNVDSDTITGGRLDDNIFGDEGDDTLKGDKGDDTLEGNDGYEWMYGGIGADTINGGTEGDNIFGEDDDEADMIFDLRKASTRLQPTHFLT